MKVIHLNRSNRKNRMNEAKPCVMALGFFDGVHLGHQEVIKSAKREADKRNLPLVVMSFFPHPKEVLSKEDKLFPYLIPQEKKQEKLAELGVVIYYLVHFDKEFAVLPPDEFVKKYLLDFGAVIVVAGFDFTYGCNGKGHMERMNSDSNGLLDVIRVGKIEFTGEKISSTMIRNLIFSGKVKQIPFFLGEPYQMKGTVLLNKEDMNVLISPFYLLPPPGRYKVIVSNGFRTCQLEAIIHNEQLILNLPEKEDSPFSNNEVISIVWEEKLTNEYATSFDQRKSPLTPIRS
ncbi:FAD synthetase family protein [Bacillus sp. V3B]|uniref:FAD synthetase family protein n=1 Tax=Bacillus sp. V3B TaxID=2804915 RepID=UPI002108E414|nr:FAD synthetase family protein [Bacillus sp. V3B]MCQ6275986.1 FAD synthetase family protein [Bacillus sp. V3B]